MERYFKRKLPPAFEENGDHLRRRNAEVNMPELPMDPGLRPRISDYHPHIRDQVRRAYLLRGPCQPRDHHFPSKKFGQASRRFVPVWFDEYPSWLEYSVSKDAAFCLFCYLFKPQVGEQGGGDSFIGKGFSNWKKKERFRTHVGGHSSAHNHAWKNCEELMKQNKYILTCLSKPSLNALIDCLRFVLQQELAFYDNDRFGDPSNGNFVELLKFLANYNEDVRAIALKNTPEVLKLTSPEIQRDIVSVASIETIDVIIREMGDELFSILIDEASDITTDEQMAIIFRYVDKRGQVIERFIGLECVTNITAFSLKVAIDKLFSRLGLSMSRLRGVGYNRANNMQGHFDGLKELILKENECAYSIHCFSHQLQLTIVAMAKNHIEVQSLFNVVDNVVNIVRASCKHNDVPQEKPALTVVQKVPVGEVSSGQGLIQESTLKCFNETCWGSYFNTFVSIITMFSSIVDALELIVDDGSNSERKCEANNLLELILSFKFLFNLHLMKDILGLTNELSQVLQRKDPDVVNAMKLVGLCKRRLQMMRESGWDSFLGQVSSFCVKHSIEVPTMDDIFLTQAQARHKAQEMTNLHHYRFELFETILDMQIQGLNNCFSEMNMELLLCLACLYPNDSFAAFNKQKLIRLAEFYPKEFSAIDLMALETQLEVYIMDVRSSIEFSGLKGIGDLAKKLVETKKDKVYKLVYSLVTLALILPIVSANVERAFSATNLVQTLLRTRMMDQWMNDSLVLYIEKDVFKSIKNEAIIQRIKNMKMR